MDFLHIAMAERVTCACGQELHRPLPVICPRCRKRIVFVRRRWRGAMMQWTLIVGLFVALIVYLWWLVGR